MKNTYCILLIFLLLCTNSVFGQPKCYIEHYSTDDGLPQHTIMDIIQDRKGYMWFSTWNGLSRFDGYNFHSYKIQSGDIYHMRSNRIDFICEDKYGYIWTLPYDREPHRFDPRTETFMSLQSYKDSKNTFVRTRKIKPMSSGKVWFVLDENGCICITDSLFNQKAYNIENKNISANKVYNVYEDKSFNSWILADNGLYMEEHEGEQVLNSYFVAQGTDRGNSFHSVMETDNELWFGTDNGQIQIYDKKRKSFELFETHANSSVNYIQNINSNLILISTHNDGFFIYHKRIKHLDAYRKSNLPNMTTNNILSCYIDKYENIWFELDCLGVAKFSVADRTMKHFEAKIESKSANIFPPNFFIFEDILDQVCVHPRGGGFSHYDPTLDILVPFYNEPYSPNWRFSNMMHTAFSDKQGNLWLSTRTHGLEKVVFPNEVFKSTVVDPNINSSINNDIRTIFEDNNQNLWVSTKGGKIYVYDPSGKQLGYLCENGTIAYGTPIDGFCYCIMQDADKSIWIGTKGEGIYRLTSNGKGLKYTIKHYKNNPNDKYSLSHNSIYSLYQDKYGRVWVGTYGGGLNLIEEKDGVRFINSNNELTQYPIQSGPQVRIVSGDKHGNICIGTTLGLIVFSSDFKSPSNIDFKSYTRLPGNSESLSNNDVFDICTTSQGETFLATFGGGISKITQTDTNGIPLKFQSYTTANGLPSDVILSILEDKNGKLWIASEGSLTKFDPQKELFETYSEISRLVKGQYFSEGSRFKSLSGVIHIGYSKGFLSINPDKIIDNDFKPYMALTKFQIANKNIPIGADSPLKQSIDDMEEVKLNHNQNFFSIEFAALDYVDSKNITYTYKLEGFDKEWIITKKQRVASYTNMSPGEYVFRVKSTNSDGRWVDNDHVLSIIIVPSFWQTGWAFFLYFIVFVAILYAILRALFVFYRLKDKMVLDHEQTEMKTRFFMDVSHEIRTPLTMIVSPVENIIEDKTISGETKSQLQLVLKNANRMLRMVNQILDFRKIQKQKLTIQEIPVGALVIDVCSSFSKVAESRNISLNVVNNIGETKLWADSDSIEKLVYNLLSNAFKFTADEKSIDVSLSYARKDNAILLSVKDSGVGMSKEVINKLFVRFASFNTDKNNPSTGIGLSIVKEAVDRHHAKITVDSEVGVGTCFTVLFPVGVNHFSNDDNVVFTQLDISAESENKSSISEKKGDTKVPDSVEVSKQTVLIVEDDSDLRNFIHTVLVPHYEVLEAEDGLIAYDVAVASQPDFIVSDIMMPRLDGIGLLKKIKENSETSHIPFILLTARTNIESKIEGLDYGADDYITKPFNVKYLKARIESIINQRRLLYENFTGKRYVPEPSIKSGDKHRSITIQDEQFILKMKKEIEENIDNSEYVINDLALAMAMSRTVFFKKVKSLTALSPVEFIRDIKIKYAADLLKTQQYTIKEVSYMVGIGDTKYFTQCFKKQYGMTPSEYKNIKKEE